MKRITRRQWLAAVGATAIILVGVAVVFMQGDIHRNHLDPKIPFQVYTPPAAPNYDQAGSWYLNPQLAGYFTDPRKVDVFFVHGTTFDGGRSWLGPIDSNSAQEGVESVQLPNYAAPFAITGNIYAPRYRQASLFTQLTLREDAMEARQFAYRDVEAAFRRFIKTRKGGKGFVIVGVEQGGLMAERLVRDIVAPDPTLKSQLVAAYMLESLVPAAQFTASTTPGQSNNVSANVPTCASRNQTGCVIAYLSVDSGRPDKALQVLGKAVYWDNTDALAPLGSLQAVCVNPTLGATGEVTVDARRSLGATNATGLEWGTEPALISRKVSSHCLGGILFVDKPKSPSFRNTGTWEDRKKVAPYNLFYGDLAADLLNRWQTYRAASPA